MDEPNRQNETPDGSKSVVPENPEEAAESTSSVTDIIKVVADRVEPIIQIIRTFAETSLKTRQSDSRFRIHMAWIAVAVVTIIVGVATFLTFTGKMDGSTYGFLLGLITGYALTFIRDAIRPDRTGSGD
jgi:hypothetical protein